MDKLKKRMTMVAMTLFATAFVVISVLAITGGTHTQALEVTRPAAPQETAIAVRLPAEAEPVDKPAARPAAPQQPTADTKLTAATVLEEDKPPLAAPEPEPEEPAKTYTYYDVPLADDLQEYAQDLCEEYDFPYYDVVVAMIQQESTYRPQVVSATGDYGLMQINRCNHQWLYDELGITNILDERQNIHSGIYIIQQLYHKYDDIGLALMAYNCGEAGARGLWEDGIYSTSYSRSIQQTATELAERET